MTQVAIVTGGASGIGRALSAALVSRSVHVVLSLYVTAIEFGVGVHVVCPGAIETPLLDQSGMPGLPMPPSMEGVTMRTMAREAGLRRFYPPERLAPGLLMRAMIAGIARWRRKRAVE